jgi:hypothetical protein
VLRVRLSTFYRLTVLRELLDRNRWLAPRTGNSWDRSRGLVGRLKPAARLSVVIQVDGRPAKLSMTEPPTPNRVKVFGTDLRLKDSGSRAFLPSTSLTF